MSKALIPTIGVVETVIEFTLAVALPVGVYQRMIAWASTTLLMSFALTMSIALGIRVPLGYGVFTAGGGTLLLGAVASPRSTPFAGSACYSNTRDRRQVNDPARCGGEY